MDMEKVQAENAQEATPIKTVADLTIPEFRQIIREVVGELIFELEQNLPDPDEGLTLRPEFEAELAELEEAKQQGKITYLSHDEVKRRLGLHD